MIGIVMTPQVKVIGFMCMVMVVRKVVSVFTD